MSASPSKVVAGHYAVDTFAAAQKKRKRATGGNENALSPMKPTSSPSRRPLSPYNKATKQVGANMEPVCKKIKLDETEAEAAPAVSEWQLQMAELKNTIQRLSEDNDRVTSDMNRLVKEREVLLLGLVKAQENEAALRKTLQQKMSDETKMLKAFDDEMLMLETEHAAAVAKFEKSVASLSDQVMIQQRELDSMKQEHAMFGKFRLAQLKGIIRAASEHVQILERDPTLAELAEQDKLRFSGVLPIVSLEHLKQ